MGTIVLVALDSSGIRTLASLAKKSSDYSCPVCHEGVVLKQGRVKIHHYAHYPDSTCENAGESYRHMEMKYQIGELFKQRAVLRHGDIKVDFEIPYKTQYGVDRRADVVISHFFGLGVFDDTFVQPLVVECQESAISFNEILERTIDYKERHHIAWIFDQQRLTPHKRGGFRIPKEIRLFEKKFSSFNILDKNGIVYIYTTSDVPEREYEWEGETYCYVPSTIKHVHVERLTPSSGLDFMGLNHFKCINPQGL